MKRLLLALACAAGWQATGEIINCRWDHTSFRPSSELRYDTRTKVAITRTGWYETTLAHNRQVVLKSFDGLPCPTVRGRMFSQRIERNQCVRVYKSVRPVTGLPPYMDKGIALMGLGGDTPVGHLRLTWNAGNWYERGKPYPYEAYWGVIPGGPDAEGARRKMKGFCQSDRLQAQDRTNDK